MEIIERLEATRDETLRQFQLGEAAKGLDYAQLPLDLSKHVYESVRGGVIYHARRTYETHGHHEWVHSVTGVRRLKDGFDKVAAHNQKHLDQIRRALEQAD